MPLGPISILPPHHLIHHTNIALNNLHHLIRHILVNIIRNRQSSSRRLRSHHLHSRIDRLQQANRINTGQDETALVQSFWSLCRSADAHRRNRMTDRREERALLRQSSAIRNHCESIHLQAVVIVEAQRLVADHARIQFKS